MFIGGMMFGLGLCGMFMAAYFQAREREALESRLQAIEVACFKSES